MVCPRCGIEGAKMCAGLCRSCYSKHLRERNPEYRERLRAYSRAWGARNREKVRENNAAYISQEDFHLRKREYALKYNYGITVADFERMYQEQSGVCALCKNPPRGKKRLNVDHCHKSGKVRGLLCSMCNWHLSKVDNDPGVLERIAKYLGLKGEAQSA